MSDTVFLPRKLAIPGLQRIAVLPLADGTINLTANFKAGSLNLVGGPLSFNITALLKLLQDAVTDLPVLIADVTAVFAGKEPTTAGVTLLANLKQVTVLPATDGSIDVTLNLLTGTAGFNLTALLKLIQDLATDIPVLIADVEGVFATVVVPPVPPAPAVTPAPAH